MSISVLAFALLAGTALPVHTAGRTVLERDGSQDFGWPGVYFETRFRGSGVRVRFDAPADFLRLVVDGQELKQFRAPGKVDYVVGGLSPGIHQIRLEKLTESQEGGSRFVGFYALRGTVPLPLIVPRRQIEFIGDSYTVGYGNLSRTRTCTRAEVHDRTDTQAAFGPLVANHYGADYQINAYSGIGIVRNYDGGNPTVTMPGLYWHAKPQMDAPLAASGPGWRPQVIVINLGTNDFSTPLHNNERWPNQVALTTDYVDSYVRFVQRIHLLQPQASAVLMGSEVFYPQIQTVAARLRRGGFERVTTLRFTDLDHNGCDFHPSLKDDAKLAGLIEAEIDAGRLWSR